MTLQHCKPVVVFGPVTPPTDVTVNCLGGGQPGEGTIDVTADPGGSTSTVSLPSSASANLPLSGVTSVTVHYRKGESGPSSIEADVTVE